MLVRCGVDLASSFEWLEERQLERQLAEALGSCLVEPSTTDLPQLAESWVFRNCAGLSRSKALGRFDRLLAQWRAQRPHSFLSSASRG